MSKPLLFPNVQEIKLKAITRVYPRIVSGTPTSFSFDPDRKTFQLEYTPILPSGKRGTSATQIVVPAPLYPTGPTCGVDGGTPKRTPTGFDIVANPTSNTVKVQIGPKP
jgi:endoglycosylceramidase